MLRPFSHSLGFADDPAVLAPAFPSAKTGQSIASDFGVIIPPGDTWFHRILFAGNSDYSYGSGFPGFRFGDVPAFVCGTGGVPAVNPQTGVALEFAALHCLIVRVRLIDPALPFDGPIFMECYDGILPTGAADWKVEAPGIFHFATEDPAGWIPAAAGAFRCWFPAGTPPNACVEFFLSGNAP